jgi:spoIIIJ-associated protein
VSGELTAEGAGETVGEAKWNALRELELLVPLLDKDAVRFQVLSEGRRGLLGVGYEPVRVLASAGEDAVPAAAVQADESDDARRLRGLLERVAAAFGVRCRIEISESGDSLAGTYLGDDLGLLIGRRGQTIDALQVLASTIVGRGAEERREIVVDAAGYRDRRRRSLEAQALRSAEEAIRTGGRVELEPMTAAERKLVHTCLQEHGGVTTASEGAEPNRYVVVEPAA